tara:strand:- start:530 stop:1141 length:612 start_codon:yes stop_codon:yes gene_type:complete
MNISKQRLIQIIKEELQQEAHTGMGGGADPSHTVQPGGTYGHGSEPTAVAANIISIISSHKDPHEVITSFVELLHPKQKEDMVSILLGSLGVDVNKLNAALMTMNADIGDVATPSSEYGAATGAGFVKTREELERMVKDELVALLEEENKEIDEKQLSEPETKEKERLVKGMKKSADDFEERYPGRGEEVMYATATKMAKKRK